MDNYDAFLETVKTEYEETKILKKSEKGSVSILQSKQNGERFIFRNFEGSGEVYKKLSGVSCPNLPEILKVEEKEGRTAVLEEYIPGDTLFYILEGGLLKSEEAENVIFQLCKALSALHKSGIVHRDIKPENIIICGNKAVLIDFDASRNFAPEKTNDTRILGTTGYAAPEQYGISQTDARADIYSLGVVLNIMLTGKHPSIKLVGGKLGNIVQKCTMISPEKRYQNTGEIIKELEKEKKKTGRFFGVIIAFAVFVILSAFIFEGKEETQKPEITEEPKIESTEDVSKETENEKDFVGEFSQQEKEPLSGWSGETGTSNLLKEDFYDYWNPDEIIEAERITLDAPGNIEKYCSYYFDDDILKITVNEMPKEEWEKAFAELDKDDKSMNLIFTITAPSENIVKYSHQRGNGPTYKAYVNQFEAGETVMYSFDPEKDRVYGGFYFAEIVENGNEKMIMPFSHNSEFYEVLIWKDADGNIIKEILPYRIYISYGMEPISIEKEEFWMDAFWEPVNDPHRVVFITNNGIRQTRTADEMEELGFNIGVFSEPGYIHAGFGEVKDIEEIEYSEIFVVPPDARQRNKGESVNDWLKDVYAATKYIGFKGVATGIAENKMDIAQSQDGFINAMEFGKINEISDHTSSLAIFRTIESDGKTVWFTSGTEERYVILIDWYTEDPAENPDAKPEKREYFYNDFDEFVYS